MTALDSRFLSESVMGQWNCDTSLEELLKAQGRHGLSMQAGRLCTAPAYIHTAALCAHTVTLHQLHHVGLDGSTRVAGQVDLIEVPCLSC